MFKYEVDIYDLCSGTAKVALELFCREINNSDADIFVVMAHKAVRLFKLLIDQNHICENISNKIIVSSSALDFEGKYFQGKQIALVDDILISGTTIATAVQKLLYKGVPKENISIITLATDKQYFRMSFANEIGDSVLFCNTELDDANCIELSYTISKIFSYYGISYDVDFPNYGIVNFIKDKEPLLFNNLFWYTQNIRNENQKSGKIDVYSILPRECVKSELWTRIKVNLDNCVHLKIRAYVKNYPSGKKECYIVPMCLFDEITETDLDRLFNLLKPSCGSILLENNNEYVAKLRYLQFYISHKLFLIFNDLTSMDFATSPTNDCINFVFGVDNYPVISQALDEYPISKTTDLYIEGGQIDTSQLTKYWESTDGKNAKELVKENEKEDFEHTPFWINRYTTLPFIWWYKTEEIPVREELVEKPCHYINDYHRIKNKQCRLNHGFSFKSLVDIMHEVPQDYEYTSYISLFLDRAIDEGFIVPAIAHNPSTHCLCRIYRHGEDLPFTLQDECRLLYFLQCLCNNIPESIYSPSDCDNDEGIAKIAFEKIIVLFYQMGIAKDNIFNRFLGFDNIRILKPYLSVHGSVTGFVDSKKMKEDNITDHFYSESLEGGDKYITWLTAWLRNNDFIVYPEETDFGQADHATVTIDNTKIERYLKDNEKSCTCSIIKQNIENIAIMISVWYNKVTVSNGKYQFKDDAVALTSCSNAYVFASAIATELHYFTKFWDKQAQKAIQRSSSGPKFCNMLIETYKDKKHTQNTEQALHSGRHKVDLYRTGRAREVIQQVAELQNFEGVNLWNNIWDAIKNAGDSSSRELKQYTEQAIGLLYFYSACFECIKHVPFWIDGSFPEKYNIYKDKYCVQCKKTNLLAVELIAHFEEIAKKHNFDQKKNALNDFVNLTFTDTRDVIENIEAEVKSNTGSYTLQYYSSLVFEVKAINPLISDSIIMQYWNAIPESKEKTQFNIVRLLDESLNQNFVRYGMFYGYKKTKGLEEYIVGGQYLIEVYSKLCQLFDAKVYEIKAMILPNTPVGRRYKHNTHRCVSDNVAAFNEKIVKHLRERYVSGSKQQLVVGLTEFVKKSFYKNIERLEWNNSTRETQINNNGLALKVKTYYNTYISPVDSSPESSINYSIVKVVCANQSGTGLLIKTNESVLCISCAHIFKNYESNTAFALIDADNPLHIALNPIDLYQYDENTSSTPIPASQEVAVFQLNFNGKIPIDVEAIITIENFTRNSCALRNSECICCGFPSGIRQWSDRFRIIGRVDYGYLQTELTEKNSVCEGYSGGVIVLNEQINHVVGIHYGRCTIRGNESGRVIPGEIIISKIEGENTQ